ncbi:MAG: 16S rRNA (cytosine(1402)-N(4))-methyltransferase RsmH [Pseudomonadota bacterium]|nr:16S rRNA (cytosine(1402)-N(4))-methyltransferase RsmH [Pseudomonadota bacterium]
MSYPVYQFNTSRVEEEHNMNSTNSHVPVMVNEVLDGLRVNPQGTYLDATFGRGGHSRAILERLGKQGSLYVLDQDPDAIAIAQELAKKDSRVYVIAGRFSELSNVSSHLISMLDGALIDFGVSSPQLDDPKRGFSFTNDGPLDMRMNPAAGQSAREWLARASQEEISYVLKTYAGEKYADNIAEKIVSTRSINALETTKDLVRCVLAAVPSIKSSHHPATKTFQAIRMQVNDELREITLGLTLITERLRPKARLVTLTYHSLEHKAVSNTLKKRDALPDISYDLTSNLPQIRRVGAAQSPSPEEVRANVRSRSALLRIWEKKI